MRTSYEIHRSVDGVRCKHLFNANTLILPVRICLPMPGSACKSGPARPMPRWADTRSADARLGLHATRASGNVARGRVARCTWVEARVYALGNAIWRLKIISNVYSSDSEVVMTTFLLMFLMKTSSAGLDPLKSCNAARLVGFMVC